MRLKVCIAIFMTLLLTLLAFQNCGSSSESGGSSEQSQNILDGEVILLEDFEKGTGLFEFSLGGDESFKTISSQAAYEGASGIHLDASNNFYLFLNPPNSPKLTIGKSYNLSFWARRTSADPNNIPGFDVHYHSGKYQKVFVTSSTWKYHEVVFTAESEDLYLDFYIYTGSTNVVDLDNIQIIEIR